MSRFYIKPENIKDENIYVSGNEAHHILNVMRLKKGDGVVVFDGSGTEYKGLISDTGRKSLVISIKARFRNSPPKTAITLAQAIPKSEKMAYIIQKCAELGVSSIIPMVTERTIVRIARDKQTKRCLRWNRIAREASKQCGRSDVMDVKNISSFEDVLRSNRDYGLKIIPSLSGKKESLPELISNHKKGNAIAFIGPEGGFDPRETELAKDYKISPISLGPYTLRSDTAAVVTAAILSYMLNNA